MQKVESASEYASYIVTMMRKVNFNELVKQKPRLAYPIIMALVDRLQKFAERKSRLAYLIIMRSLQKVSSCDLLASECASHITVLCEQNSRGMVR